MGNLRQFLQRRTVVAVLLFAIILTATGAFGTFRIVLPLRLAFWVSSVGAGAFFLWTTERWIAPRVSNRWLRMIVTVLLAAIPSAMVGAALSLLHSPGTTTIGMRALILFPPTIVLNLLFLLVTRLVAERLVEVAVQLPSPPDDRVPPAIAAKLPPRLTRSRVIAVEAQDHYLRVVTHDGEALIHMRFSDALAELKSSDGAQVHRSWWVARQSIEAARWSGGRGELRLADNETVPVSRGFSARAKALVRRPSP